MIRLQGGKCPICLRPLTLADARMDHSHVLAARHPHPVEQACPKCLRGAICAGDNNWLSGFRDDPDFLRRALSYVERGLRGEAP